MSPFVDVGPPSQRLQPGRGRGPYTKINLPLTHLNKADIKNNENNNRGARLAQLVEHTTLDVGAVSSSPTLGIELTSKNK